MAAIDSVEKGAAFSSRSKIEEETGGRMHACAPPRFLPSNGRGRTKGDEGRVFEPTCRGFSANAASFVRVSLLSFQSFAEFVPRIKHDRSSRYRSFVSFILK